MINDHILLFTRREWERNPIIKFSKEQLNKAEKSENGFIGYFCGVKCFIQRYLLND